MPGFYRIRAFFIGILQNYSRKHNIPIEDLDLEIRQDVAEEEAIKIDGLLLEGSSWDKDNQCLIELGSHETYVKMPVMTLRAIKSADIRSSDFKCPFYVTNSRSGSISVSGFNSNFVGSFYLNPGANNVDHWTKRGAALVTQIH